MVIGSIGKTVSRRTLSRAAQPSFSTLLRLDLASTSPSRSVLVVVCGHHQVRRLTSNLELTLHFFHTNRQRSVASLALGLSTFDALHRCCCSEIIAIAS